eukprot:gb/GEZJ01004388.1/.p1 GENE.gb/GEZJ01004388.1/~~gb/GEZJ01004388.1/.p1  ORF type:complete len:533 (-),score=42.70 gb/GEZJ01004388.1/:618-2189(-)
MDHIYNAIPSGYVPAVATDPTFVHPRGARISRRVRIALVVVVTTLMFVMLTSGRNDISYYAHRLQYASRLHRPRHYFTPSQPVYVERQSSFPGLFQGVDEQPITQVHPGHHVQRSPYYGPTPQHKQWQSSNRRPHLGRSVAHTADPSVCEEKTSSSVFTFGKCPSECTPFSAGLFGECAGLVQFGCSLEMCASGFTCNLRKDLTDEFVVCPGDKVVFENVTIDSLQEVSFKLDLRAPPLKTDMYMLSDGTGSMSVAISTAKERALEIMNVFGSRPNVRFGVGMFRDENDPNYGFTNQQSITDNKDLVTAAINAQSAVGGGDVDEANLVALYKIATDPSIGWREGSRRILLYFGDYPGHEPTCISGGTRLDRNSVIDALNSAFITTIAINFGKMDIVPSRYGCSSGSAGSGQTTAITTSTNGSVLTETDQSKLVEGIETLIEGLPRILDVDGSECAAQMTFTHTPALPTIFTSDAVTTVTNTFSVKSSICETKGAFDCNFRYTESGGDLDAANLEFVNIQGCPE